MFILGMSGQLRIVLSKVKVVQFQEGACSPFRCCLGLFLIEMVYHLQLMFIPMAHVEGPSRSRNSGYVRAKSIAGA